MRGIYFSRVIARDEGNDAPPCPLLIVNSVRPRKPHGKPHGTRLPKKEKGVHLHPLSLTNDHYSASSK